MTTHTIESYTSKILLQTDDVAALEKYCGAAGFLSSLGVSLGIYLKGLADCFPNQLSLDTTELYTFIEVLLGCLHESMSFNADRSCSGLTSLYSHKT